LHFYSAGKADGTQPLLTGSLPQSIANLTSLQALYLQDNYIYGDFPQSIFTLPNIIDVFLLNTGLTVSFPPTVSSTIESLCVVLKREKVGIIS
jgi:hypothetical protein